METYWTNALKEYPINSKWKNKATGDIYKVTELADAGLYAAIKLESEHTVSMVCSANMHLEFTRL